MALICLYCRQETLPKPPPADTGPVVIACVRCGCEYSAGLLRAADPAEWQKALDGDPHYRIERLPPRVTVHRSWI
jgi:hypothetical protein